MTRTSFCAAAIVIACLAALGAAALCSAAARTPRPERSQPRPAGGSAPIVRTHTLRLAGGLTAGRATAAGRLTDLTGRGASAATVLDAGMRFTMAGVVCDPTTASGSVVLRLRTSLDGRSWSPWRSAPLEVAGDKAGAPRCFTEPVWTGAARYVAVRAAMTGRSAPVTLTHVRLVALDSEPDARDAPRANTSVRQPSTVVARAGDGFAAPAPRSSAAPVIVTRRQWGADESLRGAKPDYARVKMAFVHHTATGNSYTAAEAPAVVRGIYAYHTRSLGWSDIGYNFLIDRFGTIYEGRYGGMRRGVVGAQVLGFNAGSFGVSVIGNFATSAPPAVALASLEELLAWKLRLHHLDPLGTARLRCEYGEKYRTGSLVTFPVIAGHRQANFTECPGNILYPLLPTIRLEVSGRPQPPIVSLVRATPVRFSPNGDGQADTTTLAFSLTKTAHWAMEVRDPAGKRIGSYSGDGSADSATWDGTGPGGHACPDGVYTAVLSASSELGVAAPRTVKMIIDTTPPEPPQVRVRPDVFSPNGDGSDDDVTVRYVTAERCDTRVSVLGADGKVLRRLAEWRSQPAGAHSSTWDGRVPAGGKLVPADEGMYALSVECRDAAANVSSQAASVTLDRTLGHPAATPQTISPNGDGVTDQTALGFRLTRQATVVVDVRVDGKRVRTFRLGSLDAGSHSVVWDGVTEAGVTLGSCRPTFTVTARSSLGVSSASAGLVIDLARPTLTAPATLSAKLGKAVSLVCTPRDAYSSTVDLSYSITDVTGAALAAGTLAGVATGRPAVVAWKAPARGVYAVKFTAADLGGNREEAPASTVLTVR